MRMSKKSLLLLLLSALLMTSCASYKPPLVVDPASIPPPLEELMTPVTPSSINVPQLLSDWTKWLEAWHSRQLACKATPASCA